MAGRAKPTMVELAIRALVDACDAESRLRTEHRRAKARRDELIDKSFDFIRTEATAEGVIQRDEAAIARYVSLARHQLERSASDWGEEDGNG